MEAAYSYCSGRGICERNGPTKQLPAKGTVLFGFPDFILAACPNLCCCFLKKSHSTKTSVPSFGKLEKYGFLKYLFVCRSQPVAGHFNSDGILDLFIQHSSNGVMKVKQTNQRFFHAFSPLRAENYLLTCNIGSDLTGGFSSSSLSFRH